MTAGFIGLIAGCTIGVAIMSLIAEKVLIQRIVDDPLVGKLSSVFVGSLMAGGLAGLGNANGGPYRWDAFLTYGIGAIILVPFAAWGGYKLRRSQNDGLSDTFG